MVVLCRFLSELFSEFVLVCLMSFLVFLGVFGMVLVIRLLVFCWLFIFWLFWVVFGMLFWMFEGGFSTVFDGLVVFW